MTILNDPHTYFMKKAMQEAENAEREDEVPVGAVIVSGNQIIGKGYNQVEKLNDPTAHAEIIAISAANQFLDSKYLEKTRIYITLEPCAMCAAAIALARIPEIIYAASDPKKGFSQYKPKLIPAKSIIRQGIMENEARNILKAYFNTKRKKEKNEKEPETL
jgi:tRNA(adenine34) deaminase